VDKIHSIIMLNKCKKMGKIEKNIQLEENRKKRWYSRRERSSGVEMKCY